MLCACCFTTSPSAFKTSRSLFCDDCELLKPKDYETNKEDALIVMRYLKFEWLPTSILYDRHALAYAKKELSNRVDIKEHAPLRGLRCHCCNNIERVHHASFKHNSPILLCRTCGDVHDVYASLFVRYDKNKSSHEPKEHLDAKYLDATCFVLTVMSLMRNEEKVAIPISLNGYVMRSFIVDFYRVQSFLEDDKNLVISYQMEHICWDRHLRQLWRLLGGDSFKFDRDKIETFDGKIFPKDQKLWFISRKTREWLNQFPKCGLPFFLSSKKD